GEVRAWDWSPDGRRLLLCRIRGAVQQLHLYDLERGSFRPLRHPGGSFGAGYFAPGAEIIAQWQDATHPTRCIALPIDGEREPRTVLPAAEVPPGRPWKSVTFASSDGQEIQGWLALPEGGGPFPTIVSIHGGPTAAEMERFSAIAQAWLDHGF